MPKHICHLVGASLTLRTHGLNLLTLVAIFLLRHIRRNDAPFCCGHECSSIIKEIATARMIQLALLLSQEAPVLGALGASTVDGGQCGVAVFASWLLESTGPDK